MNETVRVLADGTRLLAYLVPPSEMASFVQHLPSKPAVKDLFAGGALPDYTGRAIPGFLLLCLLEMLIGFARGKTLYRYNDFLVSLSLGITMLAVQLWFKQLVMECYVHIFANYSVNVAASDDSWLVWSSLMLAIDCGYYWMHRMSHTYHIMWAGHSVHHSGETYNLATALRQGALQGCFGWLFYLPLAFFFHPGYFLLHKALNTLGQFWIHTQVTGRLGLLEYVLNTPSAHRLHHQYPGNCNYAGVLIIWDRMFGTYRAEVSQRDRYGLAKQYTTLDPVWANLEHYWRVLFYPGGGFHRCCRKRARHAFTFHPLALLEPLPPAKDTWAIPDQRGERTKLNGSSKGRSVLAVFILLGLRNVGKTLDGDVNLTVLLSEGFRLALTSHVCAELGLDLALGRH
eukprot:g1920.t1